MKLRCTDVIANRETSKCKSGGEFHAWFMIFAVVRAGGHYLCNLASQPSSTHHINRFVSTLSANLKKKRKKLARQPLNYNSTALHIFVFTILAPCYNESSSLKRKNSPTRSACDLSLHIFLVSTLILSISLMKAWWRGRTQVDKPFPLFPLDDCSHFRGPCHRLISGTCPGSPLVSRCLDPLCLLSLVTLCGLIYTEQTEKEVCIVNGSLDVCKHPDKWAICISAFRPFGCFIVIVKYLLLR